MSKVRLRQLLLSFLLPLAHSADSLAAKTDTLRLAVSSPAQIVRDVDGVPQIFANAEVDLAYLQGYVHARDRLFQMDTLRRQAAGTLAELLGPTASHLHGSTLRMARAFLDDLQRAPFAAEAIKSRDDDRGSNAFLVSGRFSLSGEPLNAADQHLSLTCASCRAGVSTASLRTFASR